MIEAENWLLQDVLCPPNSHRGMFALAHTNVYTYTHIKQINAKNDVVLKIKIKS